jgi:hypothetical protein
MALWQFKFQLVAASVAQPHDVEALYLHRDQADSPKPQIVGLDREKLFARLTRLLPEKPAWCSDLRIWGEENTNDVQIWFEGDAIEAIVVRLDLRNLSLALVDGICAIAREHACVLIRGDGAVIRPTRNALIKIADRSDAARFVRDPKGFLEGPAPPELEPN